MSDYPSTPRSSEQKAQEYMTMGHSVQLIDKILADSDPGYKKNRSAQELKDIVAMNVGHLEDMVGLSDWGSEDMTAINAAITNGKAYLAS